MWLSRYFGGDADGSNFSRKQNNGQSAKELSNRWTSIIAIVLILALRSSRDMSYASNVCCLLALRCDRSQALTSTSKVSTSAYCDASGRPSDARLGSATHRCTAIVCPSDRNDCAEWVSHVLRPGTANRSRLNVHHQLTRLDSEWTGSLLGSRSTTS